eukprot:TRINITY_DN9076_c0_g1_i5.p1 TRINITY_DN9076_c0_g1~~TRINITY_DN9076_c0_g1_i5.p1  ORF type:complete len:545 (+),score=86.87 TRINITY_DN9076_c0_g1_i5:202-1836(+)
MSVYQRLLACEACDDGPELVSGNLPRLPSSVALGRPRGQSPQAWPASFSVPLTPLKATAPLATPTARAQPQQQGICEAELGGVSAGWRAGEARGSIHEDQNSLPCAEPSLAAWIADLPPCSPSQPSRPARPRTAPAAREKDATPLRPRGGLRPRTRMGPDPFASPRQRGTLDTWLRSTYDPDGKVIWWSPFKPRPLSEDTIVRPPKTLDVDEDGTSVDCGTRLQERRAPGSPTGVHSPSKALREDFERLRATERADRRRSRRQPAGRDGGFEPPVVKSAPEECHKRGSLAEMPEIGPAMAFDVLDGSDELRKAASSFANLDAVANDFAWRLSCSVLGDMAKQATKLHSEQISEHDLKAVTSEAQAVAERMDGRLRLPSRWSAAGSENAIALADRPTTWRSKAVAAVAVEQAACVLNPQDGAEEASEAPREKEPRSFEAEVAVSATPPGQFPPSPCHSPAAREAATAAALEPDSPETPAARSTGDGGASCPAVASPVATATPCRSPGSNAEKKSVVASPPSRGLWRWIPRFPMWRSPKTSKSPAK